MILHFENDRSGGTKALLFYSAIMALSLYFFPRTEMLAFIGWIVAVAAGALFSTWLIVKHRRRVARVDNGIFTWNTFAIAAPPRSVAVDEILAYRITSGNDSPTYKGEILTSEGWSLVGTFYKPEHRRIATGLQSINPVIRWVEID